MLRFGYLYVEVKFLWRIKDGLNHSNYHPPKITSSVSPPPRQSTLLSTLTNTQSVAASYEFTTLTCIPGVIEYKGANIQLLDLPGIIEGASQGKGRGRQVRKGSLGAG